MKYNGIDLPLQAVKNKDIELLCTALFTFTPTPVEQEIIRIIAYREHPRVVISAYTRYGKSISVAAGVALQILLNRDRKINIIAPTHDKTSIIRNYLSQFMSTCPLFNELIPSNLTKIERLREELNKRRMTFNNGYELLTLSAQGTGMRLMGFGGDVILDESCEIPFEVYQSKIHRMLADYRDSMLVELGNPWNRLNQFWMHWNNLKFKKIHIPYEIGLQEGRITRDFIDEQKELLTPLQFQILYEAEFPEDAEDTLIRSKWITEALEREPLREGELNYGLDVAEQGNDLTVLTKWLVKDNRYSLVDVWWWGKTDTMPTVGKVRRYLGEDREAVIYVDATGVGKGVYDRLRELGFNAREVKVARSPRRDKDRMLNLKSEMYWSLRCALEEGRVSLIDKGSVRLQLNEMRYEHTSGGKIRIIDPETKSSDFSDSCALVFSGVGKGLELVGDANDLF